MPSKPAVRKQASQTPGTPRYNEAHGIGEAGVNRRMRQRRYVRGLADTRDATLLVELQKKVEVFNGSTRNS